MKRLSPLFAARRRPFWLAGGAAFLIGALAAAPASIAAAIAERAAPLLEIGTVRGTVWRGEFSDVVYNHILIGDVSYRVEPLRLLTGRIVADAASREGALLARGEIALSPSSIEIRDAAAEFNLGSIRQYTFFGARYQGTARIRARSLMLSRRGCRADEAKVSTDALDALARQWSAAPFPLAGDIRCEGGRLNLALAGENGGGGARIEASVAPDLSYALTLVAEPKRADLSEALRIFGFEGDNARLSYRAAGRLKGLNS